MQDLNKVRCAIYRGGTSRGLFFHSCDLPNDTGAQDDLILAVMGSPDARQIDGLGGATSHTSKAAIIGTSDHPEADIDYTFLQVGIDRPIVDRRGMCGNLLAAVGLFAVDEGLIKAEEPVTTVRVRNLNTNSLFHVLIPVKGGRSVTQGDYRVAGVPKAGAHIRVEFLSPHGHVTGRLLPTGNPRDLVEVDGRPYGVTIVDASNPVVFVHLSDFGLSGTESVQYLNSKGDLLGLLERVRSKCAQLLGLVSDEQRAGLDSPILPRLCLLSQPVEYLASTGEVIFPSKQDVTCKMLSMQLFHQSFAVTAAVCLGVATMIKGSIPNEIVELGGWPERLRIGHPGGVMDVEVTGKLRRGTDFQGRVAVGRTARRLMDGFAYFPRREE